MRPLAAAFASSFLAVAAGCRGLSGGPGARTDRGVLLEELTWMEAEKVLSPDAVVLLPIGAAAKEHGPHLLLKNDWILAQTLTRRVMERVDVVVAPTVAYHFYPAFVEYPGSTTLRLETARDLVVEICRSLARHGPRRFYALNTGISTIRALAPAAETLAAEGIVFRYSDLRELGGEVVAAVQRQQRGTHADEIETSMVLFLDPDSVDLERAVRDDSPRGEGGLTRDPAGKGTYSPSGVWGDATLATREKGKRVVEAIVDGIVREIEALRQAPVPLR